MLNMQETIKEIQLKMLRSVIEKENSIHEFASQSNISNNFAEEIAFGLNTKGLIEVGGDFLNGYGDRLIWGNLKGREAIVDHSLLDSSASNIVHNNTIGNSTITNNNYDNSKHTNFSHSPINLDMSQNSSTPVQSPAKKTYAPVVIAITGILTLIVIVAVNWDKITSIFN